MINNRLAGDYQSGKLLFTWLSLVMSLMVSFCAVLSPRDVLDDIWDINESVSVFFIKKKKNTLVPQNIHKTTSSKVSDPNMNFPSTELIYRMNHIPK